jgi:hypothetical protein
MPRHHFGILAVFAILGAAACSRSSSTDASGSPSSALSASGAPAGSTLGPPGVRTGAPELEASAVELIEAYEGGAARAGERFGGKHVLVRGTLGEVTKDSPRGTVVTLPKDPKADTPGVRCFVRAGEEPELASITRGDPVDVVGIVEKFDKHVELGSCVVNTQLKACGVVQKALGRGSCEQDRDKLGAILVLGTDRAELVCHTRAGFEAWRAKWASVPAEERRARMIDVDTTFCHVVHETLTPRLAVDFSSALSRIRWVNDVPTLAP